MTIVLFLALFKHATTWPSDIKRYIWHAHKDCFLELSTVSHTRHPSFRKSGHKNYCNKLNRLLAFGGGSPRVVVSTAAFHARVRGWFPISAVWKKQKMFLPHPRVKVSIVGSLRDREVACSASDRQGSNFESCVWRTVSSQSSHHPQEVLLAQFSLYVHKGGLKPDSFHFISWPLVGLKMLNTIILTILAAITLSFTLWFKVNENDLVWKNAHVWYLKWKPRTTSLMYCDGI